MAFRCLASLIGTLERKSAEIMSVAAEEAGGGGDGLEEPDVTSEGASAAAAAAAAARVEVMYIPAPQGVHEAIPRGGGGSIPRARPHPGGLCPGSDAEGGVGGAPSGPPRIAVNKLGSRIALAFS